MKYSYRFFLLFFGTFLTFTEVQAQQKKWDVPAVIDRVENYYSTQKEYCFAIEYSLFESRDSKAVADRYSGQLVQRNGIGYQKINVIESVHFGDYNVSVNHKEKTISVFKAQAKAPAVALKNLLKVCPKRKLLQDKKYWVCELISDQENQYTKIYLYVDKKDFSLYKQVFYAKGSQEIEKNKKIIKLKDPRLEIFYIKNDKAFAHTDLLDKAYYFSLKNKKIIPSGRFRKYQLITY